MSEEPDATGPDEPAGPAAETPPAPKPAPRGRFARVLPSWLRRRSRVAVIAACVMVAAIGTGVGLAVTPSSPPGPQYASLPARPCAMVSAADLARYLPGATGSPESIAVGGLVKISTCKWSARSSGADRTLLAQALVFGSPSGIAQAQQSYRSTLSTLKCRCPGVTVSARPVTGLGDQAAEVFVAPQPDSDFASAPNALDPGTSLLVRSSNAVVGLGLDTTAAGTGAFMASPPSAAQLAGMMSMAHDILAVLARPASVPPSAAAAVIPEARYAGRRDPCALISAATLARYAPGAILSPVPALSSGSSQTSECDWDSASTSIAVTLRLYPGAAGAQNDFDFDARSVGITLTGARWIPDLGEAAAATFTIAPGSDTVDLFLWSGNAYLDVSYKNTGSGPSRLDRSAPLAGVIAMARDGLAALAQPATSYSPGPRYVSPHDACTVIKASTLARYAPGATVEKIPGGGDTGGPPDISTCGWGSGSVSIVLIITIESDADQAQSGFQSVVQYARQNHGSAKFEGMQPVRGVGEQASAIFQTLTGLPAVDLHAVDLYVWSGNAEVEVGCTDVGFGPPLSRAGKLAADIAMARDVLASLRHA